MNIHTPLVDEPHTSHCNKILTIQYVFLTMEAMIDAAVHIGFPREMAVKLVTSTIRGSASYAMKSSDSIGMLRNKVVMSLSSYSYL